MRIVLNGDPRDVRDGATVSDLLDDLDLAPGRRGVAVAVGAEVVPRGEWDARRLGEGDAVEVVAAIQGG